jgi:nucleoside phosphorylase
MAYSDSILHWGVNSFFHFFRLSFYSLLIATATCGACHARTVVFFFALDKDWQTFQGEVAGSATHRDVSGHTIYELKVGSTTVYAVKMGSGAVRTAMAAQAALGSRQADLAISVGPIGALADELKPGSWARVGRILPWQKNPLRMAPPDDQAEWLAPIPTTLDLPERIKNLGDISIASGEAFINSKGLRDDLAMKTGCQAVDMNLFGLLSVLDQSRIPSIHLRIVSDSASDDASIEFKEFIAGYDGTGGRLLADFVKNLPADLTAPESYPELRRMIEIPEN